MFQHLPHYRKTKQKTPASGNELRSVVCNQAELLAWVRYVIEHYDQPALAEEFKLNLELSFAMLGNGDDIQPCPFPIPLRQHRRPAAAPADLRSQWITEALISRTSQFTARLP